MTLPILMRRFVLHQLVATFVMLFCLFVPASAVGEIANSDIAGVAAGVAVAM